MKKIHIHIIFKLFNIHYELLVNKNMIIKDLLIEIINKLEIPYKFSGNEMVYINEERLMVDINKSINDINIQNGNVLYII